MTTLSEEARQIKRIWLEVYHIQCLEAITPTARKILDETSGKGRSHGNFSRAPDRSAESVDRHERRG